MGTFRMPQAKKKIFDKLSDRAGKIAGLVSSALIIIGAITGAVSWAQSQFTSAISSQIEDFRQEVKSSNESQDLAIMRLELMQLMETDPDNIVEIEMLGKKYFQAGGNSYMSRMFSAWAKEHGGDPSIVVGGK